MTEELPESITKARGAFSKDDIPHCARCGVICSSGDSYGGMWRDRRATHDLVCATCLSKEAGHPVWDPRYIERKEPAP